MIARGWVVSGALLCTVATGVAAQSPGTFEIGGFGRANFFADTLSLDRHLGGGGWLAFFPVRNLAIEAEAAYTKTRIIATSTDVSNIPLRGRLTYNIPLGENATSFQIGGGYVRDMYRTGQHFNDDGLTGLAGFRFGVSPNVGIRTSVTLDYVPSPQASRADHYVNWGIQVGLGLMLGNKYDSDHDGVKDNVDKCPNTPRGEPVDADGCSASQRDTDGDGVKDNADKCPNTPPGEKVDANGCSESQRDADGDGVPDVRDKCPNTPAGEAVDSNGCSDSQRDDDADGVPNSKDKCPNTPNGQVVDENGCPVLFEGTKKSVILKGVNFEINKAVLTDESKLILKDVATSLAARPDVRVEVQGHTDISGGRALNMRLSQARAKAVESFLEENGVSPAQLTAKGYGPDKPIATNKTAAGRAQNRRVQLVRLN